MVRALITALLVLATCAASAQPRARVSRIVSTMPTTTEMLFALGLGERVVAVSQFCRYPPEVNALPRVGSPTRADLERIFTLRPDLVVISDRNPELATRLAAAQIPFVGVAITTVDDVRAGMLRLGAAAGIEAHAREVVATMEARLDRIRSAAPAGPRPRVLLIMGRNAEALTGIVAGGATTYVDELVRIAGGTNVATAASSLPYPHLSLESILRLDPEVIVDTVDMGATAQERQRQVEVGHRLWQRHRTLSAVRAGHIYASTSDALFIPGPRLVDVAEWLAHLIHGAQRP
jgi:iron complex transport system substrate-binding protein